MKFLWQVELAAVLPALFFSGACSNQPYVWHFLILFPICLANFFAYITDFKCFSLDLGSGAYGVGVPVPSPALP
jgi:hypothetical protein